VDTAITAVRCTRWPDIIVASLPVLFLARSAVRVIGSAREEMTEVS